MPRSCSSSAELARLKMGTCASSFIYPRTYPKGLETVNNRLLAYELGVAAGVVFEERRRVGGRGVDVSIDGADEARQRASRAQLQRVRHSVGTQRPYAADPLHGTRDLSDE